MTIGNRLFSSRVGRAIGGSHKAGPLHNFPIEIQNQLDFSLWFNDFLSADVHGYLSSTDEPWKEDTIGAGTGASFALVAASNFGELALTAGTNANEGIQSQLINTAGGGTHFVTLQDGKQYAYGARMKKSIVTDNAALFGLCETDTSLLLAAGGGIATADGVLFHTGDAASSPQGEIYVATDLGGVEQTTWDHVTAATFTDGDGVHLIGGGGQGTAIAATYEDYAFSISVDDISAGTGVVRAYWRGAGSPWVQFGSIQATTLPDGALRPSFAGKNETGNCVTTFDYFWVAAER